MKKVLLFAAIAVFGLSNLNAQKSVEFGLKAGLNLANYTGDVEDNKNLASFHIGGVAEYHLSEKFSLQTELLYSQQGAKYEETFLDEKYTGKAEVNYIHLPLLAKFYVTEGFSLIGGPRLGILTSAKLKFEDEEISGFKENTNNIDFAFDFGANYKLGSGMFFEARYSAGLTDTDESSDFSAKNSLITLSLGYMFN